MRGEHILQIDDLLQRTGAAEAAAALISEAEALSRRHWTLVYLLQHPSWRGQAVLVAKYGLRGQVLIPELALESTVHLRSDLPLDSELPVRVQGVDLAQLDAFLRQD
jgi:exoribonuclease-2